MNEIDKKYQIVSAVSTQSLIQDLRQIIEQARGRVAATANYALSMMYWHIGERINREVLDNKRAEYGKLLFHQDPDEFLHALGGSLLDLLHATSGTDGVGVDEIDGDAGTGIVEQACSGVDHQ